MTKLYLVKSLLLQQEKSLVNFCTSTSDSSCILLLLLLLYLINKDACAQSPRYFIALICYIVLFGLYVKLFCQCKMQTRKNCLSSPDILYIIPTKAIINAAKKNNKDKETATLPLVLKRLLKYLYSVIAVKLYVFATCNPNTVGL